MSEPTVQVPVSLLKDLMHFFETARVRGRLYDKLAALLSQSTPTVEPPRIEDLAPGTTFVGDWAGYVTGGLFVRLNDGVRCLTPGRAFSGRAVTLASATLDIDPSTIRDVTPPKE